MKLFDAKALYKKTVELEAPLGAQSLRQVERRLNYENPMEWRKWLMILVERSAFKDHVIDSLLFDPVTIIPCDKCIIDRIARQNEGGKGNDR